MQYAAAEEETRNIPVRSLEQLCLVVLNIYLSSLISNVKSQFFRIDDAKILTLLYIDMD
jgi:hypothetical protein